MFEDITNFNIGSISVGDVLLAVITFVIGYIVARLILKMLDAFFKKSKLDRTLVSFASAACKVVIYFILAVVVAGSLGIEATSIIAVFSVAGLAVSLAAQTSLSNLAGGVTLLLLKPFKVGDYVEAGGNSGTIRGLGLVYTEMVTIDNKIVFIPNSSISAADIINYTREGMRRVDLNFTASYDAPCETVRKALLEACSAIPEALGEPAPFAAISSYGDSSIEYVVRVWCKTDDYWTVYFALLENVREMYAKNGVEMTYNHVNVHVIEK